MLIINQTISTYVNWIIANSQIIISNGNATNPDDIRSAIQETAKDLGKKKKDIIYGHGLINASAALLWTADDSSKPNKGKKPSRK